MPEVSVITAVRDGERSIRATIESIRSQTFTDWEYIVVDDASDDDTAAVVEDLARTEPRLRLFRRSERSGPFAAANEGLRRARGRYVARIDGDDLALPQRFESQLAYMREHPEHRACITPWYSLTVDGRMKGPLVHIPLRPNVLRWYLGLHTLASHSSLFVELNAMRDLGGYRELPASQDYRLVCELARRGWLGVVAEPLIVKTRRPDQLSLRIGDVQRRLAVDIMREHIEEIGAEGWSDEEILALRSAGLGDRVAVSLGTDAILRWWDLTSRDETLDDEDRAELGRLASVHLRKLWGARAHERRLAVLFTVLRTGLTRPVSTARTLLGRARPAVAPPSR